MYIIIRKYKTSKEELKEFNLTCKERFIAYDYINKIFIDAGIPAKYTTFEKMLKDNKHIFTRKKINIK